MDVLSRPGRKEGKKEEGERRGKNERNERWSLGQSGSMHIGRTHQASVKCPFKPGVLD